MMKNQSNLVRWIVRAGVAAVVLLGMFVVAMLALSLVALFWSIIGPVVEMFGIATLVLIPLAVGVLFIGWTMAGWVIKYIEKEYGPWS